MMRRFLSETHFLKESEEPLSDGRRRAVATAFKA
jgi:hypothetical protein